MIARHFEIKCIPLREEMAEAEAAEQRDRAEMIAGLAIYVFGLVSGAGLYFLGLMLK